jgi:hypothetical protein
VISDDNLLERWPDRRDEVQLLSGHFPLCTAELLDEDFVTFTVLRHPLDRTVSYLHHHREMVPEDAGLTLEQVYDDDDRFNGLIHNHMTKMLSLLPGEMDDGALTRVEFTRERLERAKERLTSIDAVGLQESFEDFWDELSTRFGWRHPISRNRKAKRPPAELPAGLRDRILADNAHDLELYEFARALVRERAGKPA